MRCLGDLGCFSFVEHSTGYARQITLYVQFFFLAVTIKTKEAGLPVQVQARVGTILQDAYIPSIQQT